MKERVTRISPGRERLSAERAQAEIQAKMALERRIEALCLDYDGNRPLKRQALMDAENKAFAAGEGELKWYHGQSARLLKRKASVFIFRRENK